MSEEKEDQIEQKQNQNLLEQQIQIQNQLSEELNTNQTMKQNGEEDNSRPLNFDYQTLTPRFVCSCVKRALLRIIEQNPEADCSDIFQNLPAKCKSMIQSVDQLVKVLQSLSKKERKIDKNGVKSAILRIMEQNPEADCSDIFRHLPARCLSMIHSVDQLVQFLNKRNLLVRYVQTNPEEECENLVSELIVGCENFSITAPVDTIGDNESILEI